MEGSAHDLTYQWHSSNASVATVSQNGVARTGGQQQQGERSALGEAIVTAAMHRASHNYGQAKYVGGGV